LIKKLPKNTVNRIAAGEAIERPASAIKELLDNSLDAGAKKIRINVLTSDARSFEVTDNGSGIAPEYLELAFTSHATSKITTIEDLQHIKTKGFRGEALASILAVSEVTCLTKHVDSPQAIRLSFDKEGNPIKSLEALNNGTSIEVYQLFSKLPARLKFLKRPEAEMQAICDTVRDLAIAHPEVSFSLENKQGKQIFRTSGSNKWKETAREIFQESIPFEDLEVKLEDPELASVQIKGLVAPLSFARKNSNTIITLVNQRPVQCNIMRKAIRETFSPFLLAQKYPRIILNLELPPEDIDVNVHPTKREIRYTKANLIYKFVKNALERHLVTHSSLYQGTADLNTHQPTAPPAIEDSSDELSMFTTQQTKDSQISNPEYPIGASLSEPTPQIDSTSPFQSTLPPMNIFFQVEQLEMKQDLQGNMRPFQEHKSTGVSFCLKHNNLCLIGSLRGSHRSMRESYIQSLQEWLHKVYQILSMLQQPAALKSRQEDLFNRPEMPPSIPTRRKISLQTLEKIWSRDGWRCVYCGKYVLHPSLIRRAFQEINDLKFWSELGSNRESKTSKVRLLREHQATHDHAIPVSQAKSLEEQESNLYTCCRSCNREKSDSIDYLKWQIKKFDPWVPGKEITIGQLIFSHGSEDADIRIVKE